MARRRGSSVDWSYEWMKINGHGLEGIGANTVIQSNAASSTVGHRSSARLQGQYSACIDGPTDGDATILHLGLMLADNDLIAAGAGSFPDPSVELEAGWLALFQVPLSAEAAANGELYGNGQSRQVFDIKAQRRCRTNESFIWVAQCEIVTGTPVVDVLVGAKILMRHE